MRRKNSTLNLPKRWFSYSQWNMWQHNPAEYRRNYYEGIKMPQTKEMKFGHELAKGLEDGTILPSSLKLPNYQVTEQRIDVVIDDVPVLAFLDTYDPERFAFRERKTGKKPWDMVRVHKHEQLPFYMLCIREKFGHYDRTTHLDWLETRDTKGFADFGGVVMESPDAGGIEYTGRIETFKRTILQWELARMKRHIRGAAEAISKDYTEWLKAQGL
jgi:hypothetical protein